MPNSEFEDIKSRIANCSKTPLCYNTDFSISLSTPGKIILHGEHSVVYGKLALGASLGLRTKLQLEEYRPSEITRNSVNIELHAINLMHSYQLSDIRSCLLEESVPLQHNASKFSLDKPELVNHEILLERVESFVKTKCGSVPLSLMQKQALTSLFYLFTAMVGPLDIPLQPFNLTMKTDLTVSAGLGSSASFSVAVAAAFLQYARFKSRKWDEVASKNGIKSEKVSECAKTFTKKDLELVSKWAYAAEKIIHGTPSGLDNTICTYGSIVEFRKGTIPKAVELHHKIQVLLINTKASRNTKALVSKVASLKQMFPAVVEHILSAMDKISALALQNFLKLNQITASEEATTEECRKQVADVYNEVGVLFDLNQNLLKALGVSHPSLDAICSTLLEHGLYGKLTGAGGGGYAIATVPPGFNKTAIEKVINILTSLGFEAVFTDLGGPGITIH